MKVRSYYPEYSQNNKEPSDSHMYNSLWFNAKDLEFFIKSLRFYQSLLKKDIEKVEQNEYLSDLLDNDLKEELGLEKDVYKTKRYIDFFEQELKNEKRLLEYYISMSHRDIRYLKSICLVYIKSLYNGRNKFSAQVNTSIRILKAVDTQITRLEELMKSGVFASATPVPLLIDQLEENENIEETEAEEESIAHTRRPKPVLISSIEIIDSELKNRCLDLFNHFEESAQPERHDTVIVEATRILEHRLRVITKSTKEETGLKLVAKAFSSKNPMLIISHINAEQEAAHSLFRGVFGYVRNKTHHNLLADLSPERVLQILGLIDYLIYLLSSAKYNEEYNS